MELKDIFKAIGLPEEIDSVEKFQEAFKKDYIPKAALPEAPEVQELINKSVGKRFGSFETELKRSFKEMEIEPEGEKLEDLFKDGITKVSGLVTSIKDDKNKTTDQQVKKITEDLNKYKSQYEQEKERAEAANAKAEEWETNFNSFKHELKLNTALSEAKKTLKFRDNASDLEKKGFEAHISSIAKFDFTEDGELGVFNAKGERLMTEAGNKHLTAEEFLQNQAKETGLWKNNDAGQITTRKTTPDNGSMPAQRVKVYK